MFEDCSQPPKKVHIYYSEYYDNNIQYICHVYRVNHVSKPIYVPKDFKTIADHMTLPRLYMELFAVVCIETSHYVAFVKSGSGPDAPWCFFDSMADRKGNVLYR